MTVAEEISQKLAAHLAKPAEIIAEYLLIKERNEFENLHKEHLNDYEKANEKLYADKVAFVKHKNKGSLDFDLMNFLKAEIGKFLFMIRGKGGEEFFEHDKFRELLGWYNGNLTVKYKIVNDKVVSELIQDYAVIAKAHGKAPITLDFKFLKLNNTVGTAARLSATTKVLEEIRSGMHNLADVHKPAVGSSPESKEISNFEKNEIGSRQNGEDEFILLKWNGSVDVLYKIFNYLRTEAQKGYRRRKMLEASETDIDTLIHLNFCDNNGIQFPQKENTPSRLKHRKFLWRGKANALVDVFYQMLCAKIPGTNINWLEAPHDDIIKFLQRNFDSKTKDKRGKLEAGTLMRNLPLNPGQTIVKKTIWRISIENFLQQTNAEK